MAEGKKHRLWKVGEEVQLKRSCPYRHPFEKKAWATTTIWLLILKICLPGSMRFLILSRQQRNEWLRFRRCSSTSKIITTQGKSISGIVSLNIAKSSLSNTVRKSQFIKQRSKPLTNCRLQNSYPVNLYLRNFISWQSTKSKTTLSTVRSEKRKKNCWLPNGRLKRFWISTGRKSRKKNRRKRKRRTFVKAKSHGLYSSPEGADRRYFLFSDFGAFNHEQIFILLFFGKRLKIV